MANVFGYNINNPVTGSSNPFEFGVSEGIAGAIGRPTNDLIPNNVQNTIARANPVAGAVNLGSKGAQSFKSAPTRTSGVLGTATSSGGSGATPGSNPGPNPNQGMSFDDVYKKYYQGWDRAAAEPDFKATGGPAAARQSGPSQDDIMREIEGLYGGSNDYLNQAEGAIRADYPNAMAEAESIFNTNLSSLGNSKQSAFDSLTQQSNKATSAKENALAAGRRLFQEQQMGANQRFGGSSSAGQAFSEIQAREQARQFGETGRQHADITNQIETQRNNVEREFQTGKLQLEQQKQSAVSQATRDFQNKLLQISQNRAQIGEAKAQARLGALQELRNQVFSIEQQNTQFNQQLSMMREQANLQLQNFGQSASGATSQASSLVSGYNPPITSQYGAGAGLGQQQPQQPQMMGQISTSRRPDEYQFA